MSAVVLVGGGGHCRSVIDVIEQAGLYSILGVLEKEGFSEAVMSKKEKKKISFFNLGPKNDWTKILDKNLTEKIEQAFEESMKDLNYI